MKPSRVRFDKPGAIVLAAVALACSSPFGGSAIDVTVDVEPRQIVLGSGEPATITVTARNTGDRRIVWGEGSSSCQLHAAVILAGVERSIGRRACTSDLAEQGLDPGEDRTESWTWDGETFDPGEYAIQGRAGNEARSAPVTVEIVAAP